MPHPYTFTVDTIGCLVSLTTSALLQNFLNSRPLAERHILNRQLLILVYYQYLYTSRAYFISFLALAFHNQMDMFMDNFPALSSFILGPRHLTVLLYATYCSLSFSRLLLVVSPTIFLNINSRRGFYLTGLFTLSASGVSLLINFLMCDFGENYKPIEHWTMAPYEIGIDEQKCILNLTKSHNNSLSNSEKHEGCIAFPMLSLIFCVTFIFEVLKAVVFVTKRISNKKKIIDTQRKHEAPCTNTSQAINFSQTTLFVSLNDLNDIPLEEINSDLSQPVESVPNQEPKSESSLLNIIPEEQPSNIGLPSTLNHRIPAESFEQVDSKNTNISNEEDLQTVLKNQKILKYELNEVLDINQISLEFESNLEMEIAGVEQNVSNEYQFTDNVSNKHNNNEESCVFNENEQVTVQEDILTTTTENASPIKNSSKLKKQDHQNSGGEINPQNDISDPKTTIWKELLNDLKLLFVRTGSYMVFGCVLYLVVGFTLAIRVKFQNSPCKTPTNHFVYIYGRILAYFSPIVWIVFDLNIRNYTIEQVNKLINYILSFLK